MKLVFAFGCPHSGTTYLWRMLEAAVEGNNSRLIDAADHADVYRITEANPIHPCLAKRGLLGLSMMFCGCVIVRIVRNPVDIFESFYAKRLPEHGAYMEGVNDDGRIFEFIMTEREHVHHQKAKYKIWRAEWEAKGKLRQGWPFNLIEVVYEELDSKIGKQRLADQLGEHVPGLGFHIMNYLEHTWKKQPIRHGRLQMGITETLLPEGLKEKIERRCSSLS